MNSYTETSTRLSRGHIGALDGVRGLAILLVLMYHFGGSAKALGIQSKVLAVSGLGWCGVDLFFVLSGFLITGILYDSCNESRYFLNFYARRTLRIFPLYYGALVLVLALRDFWPGAGIWGSANPLWQVFYLTNVIIALKGPSASGIVAHYWSLAVEEHFYLVWPLLIYYCTRRQMMTISFLLVVVALVLRIALVIGGVDKVAVYVLTLTRMDDLAVGSLCGLAIRGPDGLAGVMRQARWAVFLAGGCFVLMVALRRTAHELDPVLQMFGYSLIAIACGGGLLLCVGSAVLARLLNAGGLRWFGRYSYSLYVWHPIINMILLHSTLTAYLLADDGGSRIALLVTSFIACLLVSFLSFHLWESRFLALKRFFTSQEHVPTLGRHPAAIGVARQGDASSLTR